MARLKPTRTMRIGLMLGAGGFMLVVVATGLWLADIGGPIMPTLINLGATVALAGAIVLGFGGVRYMRRHRDVVGRREAELKAMGEAEAGDTPAEEAELPPDKRREARDARAEDEGKPVPSQPEMAPATESGKSHETIAKEAKNPPLEVSDKGTKVRPLPAAS